VSAKALGISGSEGTGTLQIELSRMPASATSLTLTPLSAERRAGSSRVTDFVLPGVQEVHEGAVVLHPISDRIVRPGSDEAVFFRNRVGYERRLLHLEIFKGLEADVVLLVLGEKKNLQDRAQAIYVQGSRAKHVLYLYERKH
jgi:hypothetical protein